MNPDLVVITEHIPKDACAYFCHSHFVGRDLIKQLFLQGCKEAFHPGIIITVTHSAQALLNLIPLQLIPEGLAGILTASVRMKDSSFYGKTPGCGNYGINA